MCDLSMEGNGKGIKGRETRVKQTESEASSPLAAYAAKLSKKEELDDGEENAGNR
jgi:hypothetical protein